MTQAAGDAAAGSQVTTIGMPSSFAFKALRGFLYEGDILASETFEVKLSDVAQAVEVLHASYGPLLEQFVDRLTTSPLQ